MEGMNLLELAPRRAMQWSENDGRVIVERRRPESPWRAPIAWMSYAMSVKRLRLDEIGSFAWMLFDGHHTVAQVADALRNEFGQRVEPAEERLGELVRQLHRGRLVAFPGIDEDPSAMEFSHGSRL